MPPPGFPMTRSNVKLLQFFLAALCGLALATPARAQDRLRVARNIAVGPGEAAGDVMCFACSMRVRGTLSGDAVAFAGEIEIEGTPSGDAVAIGGGIRLGPAANLAGDAVAIGGPIHKEPTSHLAGDQVPLPWFAFPGQRHLYLRGVASLVGMQLAMFLIFYALARHRRVENMAGTFAGRPVWSLITGLAVMVVAALLYVLADKLKRCSDPADWMITAALMITFELGYVGLCYWLGRKLMRQNAPLVAGLTGVAVLLVLQLVPLVGFFAFVLLFVLASGCAAFSGFGRVRRGIAAAEIPG